MGDKVMSRKTKPDIYSFDVTEVGKQWGFIGEKRPYHHTPPINLVFAMREALNIVSEEGLENSWNRHLAAHSSSGRDSTSSDSSPSSRTLRTGSPLSTASPFQRDSTPASSSPTPTTSTTSRSAADSAEPPERSSELV